jgi:tetratricopeptide (TPR) repeat protein
MKKSVLIIIITLLSAFNLFAQWQSEIDKANKAYKEGFFENAVTLYKKVIDQGYTSSELYYNLGNAYFKSGEIPLAILNYERAKRLDPANEDISHNLQIANTRIIDKIDQLPALFYEKWWDSLQQFLSPDGWAITTLSLFFILFVTLAFFLLSRSLKTRKTLLIVAIFFLTTTILSFILSLQTYNEAMQSKEAIVFDASLPVKSSPEETGVDLFIIHEGLKVTIVDELSNWKEIKIANGSKGWVKNEALVII